MHLCVWGAGELYPLQPPVEPRRGVGTGCQLLVTMPAWLPPLGSAFVTFEADSPPFPLSSAQGSRVSLINFVLREQMARAESGGIHLPLFFFF